MFVFILSTWDLLVTWNRPNCFTISEQFLVNPKTVDSIEGALWLATQTPNILSICHCFSIYLVRNYITSESVAWLDIYLTISQPGAYPPPNTSILVNSFQVLHN